MRKRRKMLKPPLTCFSSARVGRKLEELAAGGRLEDEPRCAVADVGFEHGRERRAEVDFAGAVFGFKIMLDLTPLAFSH